MATFKIKDIEKVMQVNIYEVEAETEQEALDKYCNELAGSLECVNDYFSDNEKEGIFIDK